LRVESLFASPLALQVGGVPIPDSAVIVGGTAVIVVLIVLSAFFSSSEIAMFSLPSHRLEALVEEGKPGARTLERLKSDPHRLLVTILVGNNLVNIAMSSIATGLLAYLLGNQGLAVAISTFGITAVVLLFGESAPKSYAVENTESWALRISRPLKLAETLLLPLIILFDYLTRQVNRITGGRAAIQTPTSHARRYRTSSRPGSARGVRRGRNGRCSSAPCGSTTPSPKEVMTPRLDMDAISTEASVDEAIEECINGGHSRLPVYEGSLDNVIGIVHILDLVRDRTYGGEAGRDVDLEELIEPTLHVPEESKNVDDLRSSSSRPRGLVTMGPRCATNASTWSSSSTSSARPRGW